MAHEIENMFSVGILPWHRLGTVLDAPPTTADAIRLAGLDWSVSTTAMAVAETISASIGPDGKPAVTYTRVPGAYCTRRSSDGRVLGVVGKQYRPLQNSEAFAFFDRFLDAGAATLETAGSLRDGQRVWIMAKIKRDPMDILPGDPVEAYLLLSNSHDGSLAARAGFTPTRVVCANTLAMAHADRASKLLRVKHTANIADALAAIQDAMDLAMQEFRATGEQYRRLAAQQINAADLRKYVKRVFALKDGAVGVTDAAAALLGSDTPEQEDKGGDRVLNRILPLVETGKGSDIPGVRGTLWSAYNAVTEYLTHHRGRDASTRFDSLSFGDGAALNRRALTVALDMAK